jgi:hypothetical protein
MRLDNRRLPIAVGLSLLTVFAVPLAAGHPAGVDAGEQADTYVLHNHGDTVVVNETNGVDADGVIVYGGTEGTSGAQVHDACLGLEVDTAEVHRNDPGGDPFYAYVIAQAEPVGFGDGEAVDNALDFWGLSTDDDQAAFEKACKDEGGTFVESDEVLATTAGLVPDVHP